MTIENFESQIDPKILERGYDYYQEGAVENLEETTEGQWAATVIGSEEYEVNVSVRNNEITNWDCDCPYDSGPVCKHVVAVLYAVKEENISLEVEVVEDISSSNKTVKETKPGSRKQSQPKSTPEAILQKLSIEELKEFVKEQLSHNTEFKHAFITSFADKHEGNTGTEYKKLINDIADSIAGRHGFINYRAASKLTSQIMALCTKASELLAKNNVTESLAITKAIIEEMPEIVMGMDDSDGGAGSIWDEAFENLHNIISKAPPMLKDDLFDYCMRQYPLKKYHDCGFEDYFIDILPLLISSGEQEKKFFSLIDGRIAAEQKNNFGEFTVVRLLKAKIRYLEENNRQSEALAIIGNNIEMHDFRNMLVEKALIQQNYSEAWDLCIKGIEIAERKRHAGIVTQYRCKLLDIAEKEMNIREIRALSEKLFFDNQYNLEYYRKLKNAWEKDKWPEKCEEIINKIKKPFAKGSYYDANALANVFIEEGYTDRLLLLLQINNTHLRFIDSYSAHLVEKYPAEIVELYEKSILDYSEYTGRSVYNDVARYLKKMAKIPGGELVAHKLVIQFKEKYRNRRAMLEVLNKHFK